MRRKTYNLVVADFPWQYSNRQNGSVDGRYATLSVEEIRSLMVFHAQYTFAPDCVLALWVTTPFKWSAQMFLDECGFDYRTTLYWDKLRFGTGYWFRGQVEELWVAKRGTVGVPRLPVRNIHQEKPGPPLGQARVVPGPADSPREGAGVEPSPRVVRAPPPTRLAVRGLGTDRTRPQEATAVKFYVATSFSNKDQQREVAQALQARGRHHQTYDWTLTERYRDDVHRVEIATAEVAGVLAADVVVVLLPGGLGTHAELGVALGHLAFRAPEKRVVVWSWDGSHFEDPTAPPFYFCEGVERVTGPLSDLVDYLA